MHASSSATAPGRRSAISASAASHSVAAVANVHHCQFQANVKKIPARALGDVQLLFGTFSQRGAGAARNLEPSINALAEA